MSPRNGTGSLEHVNVTVRDPAASAAVLERLFGWHVRWQGPSMLGGHTVHVGTDDSYIALYTPGETQAADPAAAGPAAEDIVGTLHHIGVTVDDLDATERRVVDEGFTPYNHGDYEPGRRFYFDDADGIEFEVVSYRG